MRATIASLLAAAFVLAAPAVAGTSGLRGVVKKGPTAPVCMAESPCTKPAPGIQITFTRGTLVRRVTTAQDGTYRIALPAGTYRVTIGTFKTTYMPHTAVVPAGRVATRNFLIDTGIR